MDSCGLFYNDDRVGVMQLKNIITFTEDYHGINIDDEKEQSPKRI